LPAGGVNAVSELLPRLMSMALLGPERIEQAWQIGTACPQPESSLAKWTISASTSKRGWGEAFH
jgi:hypothetical protein